MVDRHIAPEACASAAHPHILEIVVCAIGCPGDEMSAPLGTGHWRVVRRGRRCVVQILLPQLPPYTSEREELDRKPKLWPPCAPIDRSGKRGMQSPECRRSR